MSWATILEDDDFGGLLEAALTPTAGADDDVVLEAVQVVAAAALEPDAAATIADSNVPTLLANLLSEKVADDDIVAQTVAAILRLLHYEDTRDVITERTKAPMRIVELLGHAVDAIASDADDCVYIMIVRRGLGVGGWVGGGALSNTCTTPHHTPCRITTR